MSAVIINHRGRRYEVDPPLALEQGAPPGVARAVYERYVRFRADIVSLLRQSGVQVRDIDKQIPRLVMTHHLRLNPQLARTMWIENVARMLASKYGLRRSEAESIAREARDSIDRYR